MGHNVLYIEDNPDNMLLVQRALESRGYKFLKAENGLKGVAMAESEDVDLILLDIMMPGLSGYDVCRKLRASEATALLPVVLCTSLDPKQERLNGIEAGAGRGAEV